MEFRDNGQLVMVSIVATCPTACSRSIPSSIRSAGTEFRTYQRDLADRSLAAPWDCPSYL